MQLEIQPIDLRDPAHYERVFGLIAKAFPQLPLTMEGVRNDLAARFFEEEALYLGIWHKGQLVAFNAFLPHTLHWQGEPLQAYQSAYSATLPEFSGRGLFSSIQEEARLQLRARGGRLIIGYPNSASFELFTQKLGFSYVDHHLVCKLRTVFKDRMALPANAQLPEQLVLPHDHLLSWKRLKYADKVVDRHGNNRIWGVTKQYRKWGITVNYLAVGGIRLDAPASLEADLNATAQKAGLSWLRLEMLPDSPLAQMIAPRRLKRVPTPFIWYALDNEHWEARHFGFLEGLRDAF
ncbi:MAG: GNAT family N-acetyltransferase [Bacteroidetes bacterium]|nr:GNAT family N-acetyltransferase [Bacteroidota bacterium]